MDNKNLITFIHVAELNSFTKAAEALGYSQSAISFQIKQLESELNSQLFERINHTIALTEKGRQVLKYAHQINKLTQELQKTIQDDSMIKGHVRLAMADSLCNSMFQEGFLTFRTRYPGITLKIITAGTDEMFRLMNHNEVDAILTLDSRIYNTEYVTAREEKIGVHFVADAANPLCQKKQLSVRELVDMPFILTEKRMSYRRLMDEKLAEQSLEIQPVLELGNTSLLCPLIEQKAGLSFLPDYVTAPYISEGRLAYLDVADFEIVVWKQLLYHRSKWLSPQLEIVLQYCISREFSSD